MATGLFNLKQVNQAISQGAWSGYIAPRWVEYLVVAGGGGGGNRDDNVGGAGGGAGGLLTGIVTVATGASYSVTVGAGGGVNTGATADGTNGNNSVFGNITSTGGGGGGKYNSSVQAPSGGSGGGGSRAGTNLTGGNGVSGQGNAGGLATSAFPAGGGGAGTIGLGATASVAGNGGAGIASAITGTVVAYAGGGGGSADAGTYGVGGVGGGGRGAGYGNAAAVAGSTNTGGGGGGGTGVTYTPGAGGSGIVVVRYPGNVQFYTGGTVTYSNGYIVHNFTANGTLAPTTPTVVSEYQISRSLRFNSADTAILSRTPASATSRKIWTWSAWVKRGSLGTTQVFFVAGVDGSNYTNLYFSGSITDNLEIYNYTAGVTTGYYYTQSVFRDPSAWYHIVYSVDTTQATAADRIKIYVNGVAQPTTVSTSIANGVDTFINSANQHYIGRNGPGNASQYFDGYMTEVNLIDGQALTPTSFGYVNPSTGVWTPAKFVGGYGTNGFYLNFSDNSNTTAATLGKDYSGNGNNWTPNNFSVTAGAGNDSLVDSPTSYGVDTGVGGEVRGNYATWNAILQTLGGTASTYTNGNLVASSTSSNWVLGTIRINDAKYYFELVPDSAASTFYLGINSTTDVRIAAYSGGIEASPGGGSNQGSLASWSNGDVIGVAVDGPNKTVQFYRNGSTYGTLVTYTTALDLWAFARNGGVGSSQVTANFGQRPFAYTAPSGFKALCTQNLPTPTIGATTATQAGKYFNPVLYTGTGATNSITGVGFQPDWVWIKARSSAYSHRLADSVRGAGKELFSNEDVAEATNSANGYVSSFNSDGFSLTSGVGVNGSGTTFVAWNWKANGAGSTNTAGTITSTVSANTTAGFSVVTYTGNGTSATIGHGLGVAPSFLIVKKRNAVRSWINYHQSLGNTQFLELNNTNPANTASSVWNNTTPSSTVISVGTNSSVNAASDTYVCYAFAPIAGYSAFGSYTGNGSTDGPFAFTGMRPAYVMIKNITGSLGNWVIYDTTRSTYNLSSAKLAANLSVAENDGGSLGGDTIGIDILSNGFKIRATGNNHNNSGEVYIFMALAQNPFKYSLAR